MTDDNTNLPDIRPAAFIAFWLLMIFGGSVALIVALYGVLR